MQFLGLVSVVAVLAVAGVSAASTLRGDGNTLDVTATSAGTIGEPKSAARPKAPVTKAPVVQQASAPATTTPAETTPAPAATPTPAPARPAARAGFVLVEGRTQLTDSIYAIRTGDSVIVSFDAYGFRTGRATKLEGTLRLTLPLVFGKMATAGLDTLQANQLVTNRDVTGALATTGMQVVLGNGAIARIRTLVRVGRDGPLAVGYLATIDR
jgi:hypothetical protein